MTVVLFAGVTGWTAGDPRFEQEGNPPAAGTSAPAATGTRQSSTPGPAPTAARTRYVLAPDGNEVRYRVREQLANIEFPSDAVGGTTVITGAIVFEDDGSIVASESRFVVDLTTFTSDAQMRDRYIQRNTLTTADSANRDAVFVPTTVTGLRMPLSGSGQVTFRISGPFTVRGNTHTTTWDVTASPTPQGVRGTAKTAFTFADIGLTRPRVARVLSVVDTIRLEYDFNLVRDPAR